MPEIDDNLIRSRLFAEAKWEDVPSKPGFKQLRIKVDSEEERLAFNRISFAMQTEIWTERKARTNPRMDAEEKAMNERRNAFNRAHPGWSKKKPPLLNESDKEFTFQVPAWVLEHEQYRAKNWFAVNNLVITPSNETPYQIKVEEKPTPTPLEKLDDKIKNELQIVVKGFRNSNISAATSVNVTQFFDPLIIKDNRSFVEMVGGKPKHLG